MSQREAYLVAGYSPKQAPATLDIHACALAKTDKVMIRLAELNKKAEDAAITTVVERRKILSQIERAKVGDFTDERGNLSITGKVKLMSAAVQEIKTEQTLLGYRTTLKLRDPIAAITEHNKMDGVYKDGTTVNIINQIKTIEVRLSGGS
jgi:hypothetical protein